MAIFIDGQQARGSLIVDGDLTIPLPTYKTVSGSVATFDTDMTENLISCIADITAGGGGGTPSNPKPISGKTEILIYLECGSQHQLFNANLGQTVYGGYIDVVTGKITETMSQLVDLGDYTWVNEGNGQARVSVMQPSYLFKGNVICDSYQGSNSTTLTDNTIAITNSQLYPIIRVKDTVNITDSTSASDIKTFMTGKKAVFELTTPIEIDVNSIAIPTFNGTNKISAEGFNISTKYILSVSEYLRQL